MDATLPDETLQEFLRRLFGHQSSDEVTDPRHVAERVHHSAMISGITQAKRCVILPTRSVGNEEIIEAVTRFFRPLKFRVERDGTGATLHQITAGDESLMICITNHTLALAPATIYVTVNKLP